MKILGRRTANPQPRISGGFTLLEMLLVIAIIAILAALLLPALMKGKQKVQQTFCLNNLRQTGIGFQNYAHDHNNAFPMQLAQRQGGSAEYNTPYIGNRLFSFSFRHFQVLSNELDTPKILICPADLKKSASGRFSALDNRNISYWVAPNSQFGNANSFLSGDWNITYRKPATASSSGGSQTNNTGLVWTDALHQWRGNVLFADGHVEGLNSYDLSQRYLASIAVQNPVARTTPQSPRTNPATTQGNSGGNSVGGGGNSSSRAGNPSPASNSGSGRAAASPTALQPGPSTVPPTIAGPEAKGPWDKPAAEVPSHTSVPRTDSTVPGSRPVAQNSTVASAAIETEAPPVISNPSNVPNPQPVDDPEWDTPTFRKVTQGFGFIYLLLLLIAIAILYYYVRKARQAREARL